MGDAGIIPFQEGSIHLRIINSFFFVLRIAPRVWNFTLYTPFAGVTVDRKPIIQEAND